MTSILSPHNVGLNPKFWVTINGLSFPLEYMHVTQAAYGVADTLTIHTPLATCPIDVGAMSQVVKGAAVVISGGYADNNGTSQLVQGILEEIDNDYDSDVMTITARGLLANLIDARISLRIDMNSTVHDVITKLIEKYKLVPDVAPSSVPVGVILKGDFVAMTRNMRVLDFIHMLCRETGWTTRAVGGKIVVGPPPSSDKPTLTRNWSKGEFTSLKIRHNALHNRNIKVKIVSYIQSTKQASASSKQGPLSKMLGLPVPGSSLQSKPPTYRGGRVSGFTSVGERDNVEEYVIPVSGKTQQECDDLALTLAEEIGRHEFTARFKITLSPSELTTVMQTSPDFNVNITGCNQPSNNGLYFPKHVEWEWSAEAETGLDIVCEAVNHVLPAPAGGAPNATLEGLPTG